MKIKTPQTNTIFQIVKTYLGLAKFNSEQLTIYRHLATHLHEKYY